MNVKHLAGYFCIAIAFASPVAIAQVSLRVNNMIMVNATGDPGENCTSLRTVLGSILDSGATNPYHVRLEPGDYGCGNIVPDNILVPAFVTVEGTGIDTTTIRGTSDNPRGLVQLLDGSELRFLTVINEGDASNPETTAVGMESSGTGEISARVSHIQAVAALASGVSTGLTVYGENAVNRALMKVHHSSASGEDHALGCPGGDPQTSSFLIDAGQLTGPGGLVQPTQCDTAEITCVNSRDDNNDPLNANCEATATTFAIGDTGPAGGIVFYITDGGRHGLEAALKDQSTGVEWGCSGTDLAGAHELGVGTGKQNTIDIYTACSERPIAASLAVGYRGPTLETLGWFLPSRDELNQLYLQKDVVGGFSTGSYWTSSEFVEFGDVSAWVQIFDSFGTWGGSSKTTTNRVRAVRAF